MFRFSVFRYAALLLVLLLAPAGPSAATDMLTTVQTALYAGHTQAAGDAARARLAISPDDDQARFALGAVQFLQAIEHLGHNLYRYGPRPPYGQPAGLAELPILRLPVPKNPHPEAITYEELRTTLEEFLGDLQAADTTLAAVGPGPVELPLNIGLIRLDLRGDGAASEDESLWRIFVAVTGYRGPINDPAGQLLTDFDGSDVPWLRGYCNLLMAIAEFPLAYDWHEAFEATFQALFPAGAFRHPDLAQRDRELRAQLDALGAWPEPPRPLPGQPLLPGEYQAWWNSPAGQKYQEKQRIAEPLTFSGIADLIAFVHLAHWQVIQPARLADVLRHLEAMVGFSRENWRRIMADTSTGRRWIPNPQQTGVLPNMRVTPALVAAWRQFLDEFNAVLQGKKLIPHWRFERGINLRRLLLEPQPFDPVLLIQGSAALPYLENGPLVTSAATATIMAAFGGDFFRYFVWFN